MKHLVRSSILAVLGMGFFFCTNSQLSFAAEHFSISIALPAAALETNDLDVRDAFNRPVRNHTLRKSFERLWIDSLNQLVLNSLTPARLRLLALLNISWDRFAGVIRGKIAQTARAITAWIHDKKKSFFVRLAYVSATTGINAAPFFLIPSDSPILQYLHSIISSTRILR